MGYISLQRFITSFYGSLSSGFFLGGRMGREGQTAERIVGGRGD